MSQGRSNVALVAALLALVGCAAPDSGGSAADRPDPADLVLVNGTIVTVDDERPDAEAIAIRDGRIAAVGTDAEIEPYIGDATEVIDLGGQLAIPGFVEGHGHFMGVGEAALILDLRTPSTWEEIVGLVAEATATAEPGEILRGRGWHQDKWTAPPSDTVAGFPVHDALSAVSPDHPVVLEHASGHAAFVNARALELAGIDDATPDPPGGEILRDASGRATGLLNETAQSLVGDSVLRPGGEDPARAAARARRMVELATREVLSKGVTTFTDAGSALETVDFLKTATDENLLGVRLWVMIRDANEALAENLDAYKFNDHGGLLSVGGIKLSIDGALGSRGAWLLEPYTDLPTTSGLNLIPVDSARETAELAMAHGYQLAVHAIGDRANREVLDLYAAAFAAHPEVEDPRWRIEHAQHLHPDDIPRFGELDVIASMQGVHCTSDAPWVPDRLGDRRTEEGAYVWRSLADSGALIVNGTDAPVEDVDPIASFHASVTRRLADGTLFYPDQRLGRLEALRTYTLNGAYAIREEGSRGSLTPGKLADVVVLSRDILEVPEDEIRDAEVVYTILGGKIVYEAPAKPVPRG
jgi:predicted amidohydrolase YtcJ